MDTNPAFSAADLAYIEEAYRPLEELCAERGLDPAEADALVERSLLPRPPYTLSDGRRMAPPDEFRLLDEAGSPERLWSEFDRRFRASAATARLEFTPHWNPKTEWADYVDGTYAVCLWDVTPEAMIEKERLIRTIQRLTEETSPGAELAAAVDALDALERPFTDYDRARWEWTSRALYVTAMRERFPELWAQASPR